MFGVETRENGIANFDYFSVDMLESGAFKMNKHKYVLGDFGCALCNLSKDYIWLLYTSRCV